MTEPKLPSPSVAHPEPDCSDDGGAPRSAGLPRVKRAFLATKRDELLTPVHAILDTTKMLLLDGKGLAPTQFLEDVKKIHQAGEDLRALIHKVLTPSLLAGHAGTPDIGSVQSRLRHEMLNRLNSIINYSEMWLEEAGEDFLAPFLPDLRMIHESGKRCIALIDTILASWNIEQTEIAPADPDLQVIHGMVRGILDERPERFGGTASGHLLVVDDNETNRDILRRRLELQGHRITTACDGREAFELLERHTFDLVLLDIVMPEMNGIEVLQHLKSHARLRDVPVIMISALDEIEIAVRCIEMGADDYLSKPFDPVFLKARIGACLEKKRFHEREISYLEQIECERQRADDLLHVLLPRAIVSELKATSTVAPRRYENVAVLFADIVDFTPYCEQHPPEEVVSHLQRLVEKWEEVAVRHGVQKIKTIGDAFMAASGLLIEAPNPVLNCVRCGLEMLETAQNSPTSWNLRVGIHYGQVVGGVLGRRQYLFDLWGDTVNTASRMESHGINGAITLSAAAWRQIAPYARGTSMGYVPIKGKGDLEIIRFDGFSGPLRPASE
jgi:DNA-binding response OmpR family regulator